MRSLLGQAESALEEAAGESAQLRSELQSARGATHAAGAAELHAALEQARAGHAAALAAAEAAFSQELNAVLTARERAEAEAAARQHAAEQAADAARREARGMQAQAEQALGAAEASAAEVGRLQLALDALGAAAQGAAARPAKVVVPSPLKAAKDTRPDAFRLDGET